MEAGQFWWLSNLRGGHYATIVGTARRRARPRHGRQHNRSVATGRRERRSNLQARTPALPTLELASPASLPPVRLFLLYPNYGVIAMARRSSLALRRGFDEDAGQRTAEEETGTATLRELQGEALCRRDSAAAVLRPALAPALLLCV